MGMQPTTDILLITLYRSLSPADKEQVDQWVQQQLRNSLSVTSSEAQQHFHSLVGVSTVRRTQ